jgi:hypothetical protein
MRAAAMLGLVTAGWIWGAGPARAQTTLEWIALGVKGERVTSRLDSAAVKRLAASMRTVSKRLKRIARRRLPRGLSRTQSKACASLQRVWKDAASSLEKLSSGMANSGATPGLSGGDMVQRMAQMNMQFLALQTKVQEASKNYACQSKVMKTRHDIAMNAIRNLKG